MADPQSYRSVRLEALKIEVSARSARAQAEKNETLEELVTLIKELDPIRRQTYWPSWIVREIARGQKGICPACRKTLPALHEGAVHVHHVIPWSLGGGNEPPNLKILHDVCNLAEGQRCDEDDLIEYLRGRVLNL